MDRAQRVPSNYFDYETKLTSRHVNWSRSSKIDCTRSPKRFKSSVGEPSVDRPKGMGNDRVHETDEEYRVKEIGCHLATLSNGSGNNGTKCTCKRKLEEPCSKVNVVIAEEKVAVVPS